MLLQLPVMQPAELWKRTGRYEIDELFKLNNNYTGYYARKLMELNPDLEGLFELRRMKDEAA